MKVNYNPSDLDIQCVEALGWERVSTEPPRWTDKDHRDLWLIDVPLFSIDPAAARLLEDEIERRGLEYEYIRALNAVLDTLLRDCPGSDIEHVDLDDLWSILHASPEERARAFLATLATPDTAPPML